MKIQFCTLDNCSTARGTVIVVDVVRAFTTAAFALHAGAKEIILAGSVEEALALRIRFPGSLAMGESGGLPVESFDLWNSPSQIQGKNLMGKTLVQRTSAGTQGVVRSTGASDLFAASFVVARATAQAIRKSEPDGVTFVITGVRDDNPLAGHEDQACAEYISALLRDETPEPRAYLTWASAFLENRIQGAPSGLIDAFSRDLDLCIQVDRFPFALNVQRKDGRFVMEKFV